MTDKEQIERLRAALEFYRDEWDADGDGTALVGGRQWMIASPALQDDRGERAAAALSDTGGEEICEACGLPIHGPAVVDESGDCALHPDCAGGPAAARKHDEFANMENDTPSPSARIAELEAIVWGFLLCPEIADAAPEDKDGETHSLESRARRALLKKGGETS